MKPQKEWVHMDKLEPEKLEWTRDLPAPRRRGTKKVGREGVLVSLIAGTQELFPRHTKFVLEVILSRKG